jgi:hypothetical protein
MTRAVAIVFSVAVAAVFYLGVLGVLADGCR